MLCLKKLNRYMNKKQIIILGAVIFAALILIYILTAQNIRLARDLQRYETNFRKELFDSIKTLKKDRIFIDSKIDSLQNIVKSGYDDLKTDIKKIKNVTINVQNYSAISDSALISRLLSDYGRN